MTRNGKRNQDFLEMWMLPRCRWIRRLWNPMASLAVADGCTSAFARADPTGVSPHTGILSSLLCFQRPEACGIPGGADHALESLCNCGGPVAMHQCMQFSTLTPSFRGAFDQAAQGIRARFGVDVVPSNYPPSATNVSTLHPGQAAPDALTHEHRLCFCLVQHRPATAATFEAACPALKR